MSEPIQKVTLGVNLEIRPMGGLGLPFELESITSETINEEDMPRP